MNLEKPFSLMRTAACAVLLIAGLAMASAAFAGPVVGQLDFGGVYEPIDAAGNPTTTGGATGIRFEETEYPVVLALGIFSHLAGQSVTIETPEFQFAGPFPFTLWSADAGATYFVLEAITIVAQTDTELALRGNGNVFVDGSQFDGRYLFTGQGALGFTFSSSTEARAVPAPAGLGLIGIGLVGIALTRRRFF
jgi:hypothetical protein